MSDKIRSWLDAACSTDYGYLTEKPFLIIAGTALGLLVLLLLIRLCPRRRIRAYMGETGYVEISRHALLELVYNACEQMPEVRKPSIKIRARRKLNLSVRIRVDSSAHLRDTAAFLQAHLKDALENNLGVERLGKIEILVTGIRSGTRPKVDLNEREDRPAAPGAPKIASAPVQPRNAPTPVAEHPSAFPPKKTDLEPPPKEPPESEEEDPKAEGKPRRENPADDEGDSAKSGQKKSGPDFFEKKKKI